MDRKVDRTGTMGIFKTLFATVKDMESLPSWTLAEAPLDDTLAEMR